MIIEKFLIVGSLDPFGMITIGVERPENPMKVNQSHIKIQGDLETIINFGWENGYIPVHNGLVAYTSKHQAQIGD